MSFKLLSRSAQYVRALRPLPIRFPTASTAVRTIHSTLPIFRGQFPNGDNMDRLPAQQSKPEPKKYTLGELLYDRMIDTAIVMHGENDWKKKCIQLNYQDVRKMFFDYGYFTTAEYLLQYDLSRHYTLDQIQNFNTKLSHCETLSEKKDCVMCIFKPVMK